MKNREEVFPLSLISQVIDISMTREIIVAIYKFIARKLEAIEKVYKCVLK